MMVFTLAHHENGIMTITSLGLFLMLGVSVTMATDLNVSDLTGKHLLVGRMKPSNPHAVIGEVFSVSCKIDRRRLLRGLGITVDDLFFRFDLADGRGEYIVSPAHVKKVNQSTVMLNYPDVTLDYHKAQVVCLATINATSALRINDVYLYAGYSPGVGSVSNVMTLDLVTLVVTFTKSHLNPSYPTRFSLLCQFRELESFFACPNEEIISNDTIAFTPMLPPGEQFGDNRRPINIRIISSSILGGTAIGPVTTFNLYEKYKPQQVSNMNIQYSGDQEATVQWTYNPPVPVGLLYMVVYQSKWDPEPLTRNVTGPYLTSGPFVTSLSKLHWATTYNVTITALPLVAGYPGDTSDVITLTTHESVPSSNPVVTSSGYERHTHGNRQDVVIYWQPIPEQHQNGIIIDTKIEVLIGGQGVRYILVNQSEALLHQAHICDLRTDVSYLFAVRSGTRVGSCSEIKTLINVPSVNTVLPALTNMTAVASVNTRGQRILLSWKPHTLPGISVIVHWCIGSQDYYCQGVHHTATVPVGQHNYTFLGLMEEYSHYNLGTSVESNTSNSGIHWTTCIYDDSQVPAPPVEMRTAETTLREAQLFIQSSVCTLGQGFTYMYHMKICDTTSAECKGPVQSFPVMSDGKYTINGLRAGRKYHIQVSAQSQQGTSLPVVITLKTVARNVPVIVGVTVAVAVFICVATFMLIRLRKKCNEPITIKTVPDDVEPLDRHRDSPDGGYTDYESQHPYHNESDAEQSYPLKSAEHNNISSTPMTLHLVAVDAMMLTAFSCNSHESSSEDSAQEDACDGCSAGGDYNGAQCHTVTEQQIPTGKPADHCKVLDLRQSAKAAGDMIPAVNPSCSRVDMPPGGDCDARGGVLPSRNISGVVQPCERFGPGGFMPPECGSTLCTVPGADHMTHPVDSCMDGNTSEIDTYTVRAGNTSEVDRNSIDSYSRILGVPGLPAPSEAAISIRSTCPSMQQDCEADALFDAGKPQLAENSKIVDNVLPETLSTPALISVLDLTSEEEEEESEDDAVVHESTNMASDGYSTGVHLNDDQKPTFPKLLFPEIDVTEIDSNSSDDEEISDNILSSDGYSCGVQIKPNTAYSKDNIPTLRYPVCEDAERGDGSDVENESVTLGSGPGDYFCAGQSDASQMSVTDHIPMQNLRGKSKCCVGDSKLIDLDRLDSGVYSGEPSPVPDTGRKCDNDHVITLFPDHMRDSDEAAAEESWDGYAQGVNNIC